MLKRNFNRKPIILFFNNNKNNLKNKYKKQEIEAQKKESRCLTNSLCHVAASKDGEIIHPGVLWLAVVVGRRGAER